MARIPESEIERLKLQVSVVRLVEAAGIALKPHGKDLVGRCPFHDDKTPSLVVSPKSNLWHCLGACQMGGSSIDWVMKFEGVSFRRAVDLLLHETGQAPALEVEAAAGRWRAGSGTTVAPGLKSSAACPAALTAEDPSLAVDSNDQALLRRVIAFYQATLKHSAEAQAYLARRGLDHPEVVDRFQLGFANRTLGYKLPPMATKAGASIRSALQRVGIYRDSGHEHFNGSLVIPVLDLEGSVTEVYGRKIGPRLREGTPLHLYLPGPHRGVFNEAGLVGQEEVILTEALIDALTFWCAGYRNVTASYGIEGFTDDHLAALRRHGAKRVLIAYDRDEAGNAAAEKLAARLMAEGYECYRCLFPKGMDANAYALSVQPASKSLALVIRQAEWLGKGAAPRREPSAVGEVSVEEPAVVARGITGTAEDPRAQVLSLVAEEAAKDEITTTASVMAATPASEVPPPPAHRMPPSASTPPAQIADSGELSLTLGDRVYRVRGVERNLSYDQLKVLVRVTCGAAFHVDTLEFYQAKQRSAWVKAAGIELGVAEDVLRADLGRLLLAVEQRQDELIRRQLKPGAAEALAAPLDPEAHAEALAFLRSPDLVTRIVADFERCGLVGEPSNALVGYLAAVSRKLKQPLAVLIQSTSAAGKSTLMDAVLRFVPESDRVHYSAMTGQSLFYLGEKDLKHKILAIAEEEGVRQAAYALKLLQSQGELTMASTGKDPATGKLVTEEYRVEGPVMLFLTTTAIDNDEELLNRCLVLTIDESREQTRAILKRQRQARTLAGLVADREAEAITQRQRDAQTLLRPLAVVNPYADRLGFLDDRTRLRRDHQKYLTLIDAIAFLHQHQREVKRCERGGCSIEYIEVIAADIALANRLAHEVLGRSLDELPPQTRRVLGAIHHLVAERIRGQGIERSLVRFSRKDVRERAGLSDTQARVHLERLVQLEHVAVHRGRNGQSFVYELLFEGDVADGAPRLPGLIDVDAADGAVTTTELAGFGADLAGWLRGARGPLAVTSRDEPTPRDASVAAVLPSLVAESAVPAGPRRHTNGAAHRTVATAAG
jgi:DNA primase